MCKTIKILFAKRVENGTYTINIHLLGNFGRLHKSLPCTNQKKKKNKNKNKYTYCQVPDFSINKYTDT